MADSTPTPTSDGPACSSGCSTCTLLLTRLIVPAWITAGALMKLVENDPRNLPKPIFDAVLATDGWFGLSGVAWMDFSLRSICAGELAIAACIVCMPRLARPLAITVLAIFCAILLWLIGTGWAKDGFDAVLKGSCGCFGKSGMNPLYMLLIDASLLVAVVVRSKRCSTSVPRCSGVFAAVLLGSLGLATAFAWPARTVALEDPGTHAASNGNTGTAQVGTPGSQGQAPSTAQSAGGSGQAPSTAAWPPRPAEVQPYYLPEFAAWVGKPLASQPEMALLDAPPPATIGTGTWIVMLYRADCEHCHEVLETHFVGTLKRPTLLIGIPDHDPANEQPMPCTECTIRTFLKGPNFVVQTPVLLRVRDGVVEAVCTDHEDPASLAEVLEGGQ